MRSQLFIILFAVILIGLTPLAANAQGSTIDSASYDVVPDADEFSVLQEFFEKTGGQNWKKKSNWLKGNTSADFKNWYGVQVEHGDVVGLVLDKNNLTGKVPTSLYTLSRLKNVSLTKNDLDDETKSATDAKTQQIMRARPQYGFIENKGQIVDQNNKKNETVKYLLPLANNNVLLKKNGFSYDTYVLSRKQGPAKSKKGGQDGDKTFERNSHRVDVEFVGANANPEIVAQEPSEDYLNYYTSEEAISVHHYGKLVYKNIYPNIDVEFTASPGMDKPVEYNFIVHPGGDMNQIKLKYQGASSHKLKNGQLALTLKNGTLTERIPASFWKESKTSVAISYKEISKNSESITVGFSSTSEAAKMKTSETLVIDPTPHIIWGTNYGGTLNDEARAVARDHQDNIYVTGRTYSASIATQGAFAITSAFSPSPMLLKLNKLGQVVWSTYCGAGETWGIAVDLNGVYISGQLTNPYPVNNVLIAADPTVGSVQQSNYGGGNYDGFVAKFSFDGARIWGTYYGGDGWDKLFHVATDALGNIYAVGHSYSSNTNGALTNVIATPNSYQPDKGGVGSSGVIVKFDSHGVRQWGTYYNGSEVDFRGVACDASNNVYFTGSYSSSHITGKFNSTGQHLWASTLGGGNEATDIKVDAAGQNVYVVGKGAGSNSGDSFFKKYTTTNGALAWTKLFHTTSNGAVFEGLAFDSQGDIYVTGYTNSNSAGDVATADAMQSMLVGPNDAIIVKYNTAGTVVWGTYYGGNGSDFGKSICINSEDKIIITGFTDDIIPFTQGAYQASNKGLYDMFIAEFSNSGSCSETIGGKNLPHWVVTGVGKNQIINWRDKSPEVTESINSTSQTISRGAGVAIDNCGRLAFYVMHTGVDNSNRLHIYAPDGTRLTNESIGSPLLGLNGAVGNNRVQVIPVPGTSDEWYIFYSEYASCGGGTPTINCPVSALYSKVKFIPVSNTLTILFRDIAYSNGGSQYRYTHGKAFSAHVNNDYTKKYLYMVTRPGGSSMALHRFLVDGTGAGSRYISPVVFSAQNWSGTIDGSAVELSADGNTLVISNRNEAAGYEDLIIFDLTQISNVSYTPKKIKIPDLMVDFAWLGVNTRKSILELYSTAPYNGTYSCFQYMHNSLSSIQLSPSGQYLYVAGGGRVPGQQTSRTYLLQIDIKNPDVNGKYNVKIQVQQGVETGSCGGAASGSYKAINQVQAGYDGRIYFSGNTNVLRVIPEPDCLMAQDLTPHDVDLSTATVPNIVVSGVTSINHLPEQLDWFVYPQEVAPLPGSFTLDKTSVEIDNPVSFALTSYSAANTYKVYWGDGSIQTITSTAPVTHTYTVGKMYKVALVIYYPIAVAPCPGVSVQTLDVTDCSSLVGVGINAQKYVCAIKFSSKKMEGCAATYQWDFGDGTDQSMERNPIHAYTNPGAYNVKLTVTYNCAACQGSKVYTKEVIYSTTPAEFENQVIEIESDLKDQVLSNTVSTFSDTWPLQHEEGPVEDKNGYLNGSIGVWRNNATYVFDAPRSQAPGMNLRTDGTYDYKLFSWEHAELEAVPDWIKANAMTAYSPYSYELENKDVMGVYTAALYDYSGQLPVANGVNMRNKEMAFTSFESVLTGDKLSNRSNGNWTLTSGTGEKLAVYFMYTINAGNKNMAIVEVPPSKLQAGWFADVTSETRGGRNKTAFIQSNEIICVQAHPNTTEWSVVVFKTAPAEFQWKGQMKIKTEIDVAENVIASKTIAHTGKYSLKVETTAKSFDQKILQLNRNKSYLVTAWVSTGSGTVVAPPTLQGFDIIIKDQNNVVLNTIPCAPDGPMIEGWRQIKRSFISTIDNPVIEIKFYPGTNGSAVYFDDLRLHPENGNMKSYVYDVNDFKLKAILDEENFASYFYYDAEGNLYLTKKETREGVKTLSENISYQIER